MFWASAGAVVGKYLCVGRHKAAQGLRVFIVYGAKFVGTKVALLFFLGFVVPVAVSVVVRSHCCWNYMVASWFKNS